MGNIDALLKLIDTPRDNELLRFSLGNEYLKAGQPDTAAGHLRIAVEKNPNYSAAWKLLGKALSAAGRNADAVAIYEQGIAIAEGRGDIQAAKEMKVFLKRLRPPPGTP